MSIYVTGIEPSLNLSSQTDHSQHHIGHTVNNVESNLQKVETIRDTVDTEEHTVGQANPGLRNMRYEQSDASIASPSPDSGIQIIFGISINKLFSSL